jgi:hypothetical protein
MSVADPPVSSVPGLALPRQSGASRPCSRTCWHSSSPAPLWGLSHPPRHIIWALVFLVAIVAWPIWGACAVRLFRHRVMLVAQPRNRAALPLVLARHPQQSATLLRPLLGACAPRLAPQLAPRPAGSMWSWWCTPRTAAHHGRRDPLSIGTLSAAGTVDPPAFLAAGTRIDYFVAGVRHTGTAWTVRQSPSHFTTAACRCRRRHGLREHQRPPGWHAAEVIIEPPARGSMCSRGRFLLQAGVLACATRACSPACSRSWRAPRRNPATMAIGAFVLLPVLSQPVSS